MEIMILENPWEAFNMTKEEWEVWRKESAKNWCEEHDGAKAYYHPDNYLKRPTASCPKKHHYHCEQCGKLKQIG